MAQKPTCRYCGSDSVTLDAQATWDVEAQEWRLCSTYDSGYCGECDTSQKYFDWVEVAP